MLLRIWTLSLCSTTSCTYSLCWCCVWYTYYCMCDDPQQYICNTVRISPNTTVLYCTVLHSAVYFTALHCTALYCTVLHCTVLYCIRSVRSDQITEITDQVRSEITAADQIKICRKEYCCHKNCYDTEQIPCDCYKFAFCWWVLGALSRLQWYDLHHTCSLLIK